MLIISNTFETTIMPMLIGGCETDITDTPVASWPYMAVLYIVQATVCKNTWFLLPTTFTN